MNRRGFLAAVGGLVASLSGLRAVEAAPAPVVRESILTDHFDWALYAEPGDPERVWDLDGVVLYSLPITFSLMDRRVEATEAAARFVLS